MSGYCRLVLTREAFERASKGTGLLGGCGVVGNYIFILFYFLLSIIYPMLPPSAFDFLLPTSYLPLANSPVVQYQSPVPRV